MNAPLRMNEALLIADRAFTPFQCVAWALQDGTGPVTLTVIDGTRNRLLDKQLSSSNIDPAQLEKLLNEARSELKEKGYQLQGWSMPH